MGGRARARRPALGRHLERDIERQFLTRREITSTAAVATDGADRECVTANGLHNVSSMEGGWRACQDAGRSSEAPDLFSSPLCFHAAASAAAVCGGVSGRFLSRLSVRNRKRRLSRRHAPSQRR